MEHDKYCRQKELQELREFGFYNEKAYRLAVQNTKYNSDGRAVIEKDDEWREETEWDDMFEQMIKEME